MLHGVEIGVVDIVVAEDIHELPGRCLHFREINSKRLPQSTKRQALRQSGECAPVCHGPCQGFRRKRLTISCDKDGLAAAVCGVEDLSEHGSYRDEKPLSAGPSLILGLDDIKSVELALDTID